MSSVLRSFSAGIACCLSASVVRPTSFLLEASWRGGESHVACLGRELDEELGVSLVSATYFGTYEDVSIFDRSRMITLFVYMCDIVGDPVPRSEIEAVEWVPVTCSPGDGSTFQSRVIPDIARMRGQC